ncbi:MAG: copper amine oxidase N-terminal domain-containing protein, partial [Hydrogenibacillus schlegelii]|nr:copper amine oxidase N-terminal domain-containing protein [Hydrogenibacillus schlegelii]
KAMDVAPFIKDNRTFVPVKYVAEALGVKESDIIWNPYAKSVTIFKGDRVIQMKIGSKTLIVNGSAIEMDTAPTIKDARTVLPIAWVAKALNVDYVWNDAERSVEFNYVAR